MNIDLPKQLKYLLKYPVPINVRELKAYGSSPRVFINSLPKSGTFLLRRLLFLLPQFAPRWSYHGLVAETPNLTSKVQNIKRGQYVSGHLYWSQNLVDTLNSADVLTLFIIRDLRDVAVSLANYLTYQNKQHRLHSYFSNLKSDEERLMTAITGIDVALLNDGKREESIGEHAMRFAPWLDEKLCLAVHFEDLIGSAGGGSTQKQLETFRLILKYLDIHLSEERVVEVSKQIFFKSSTTFRKGQIGDWQNHFTDAHKQAFKAVAGDALIKLGYEANYDW